MTATRSWTLWCPFRSSRLARRAKDAGETENERLPRGRWASTTLGTAKSSVINGLPTIAWSWLYALHHSITPWNRLTKSADIHLHNSKLRIPKYMGSLLTETFPRVSSEIHFSTEKACASTPSSTTPAATGDGAICACAVRVSTA